jgi:parvulin-like peptidyl-prolyl isomerase
LAKKKSKVEKPKRELNKRQRSHFKQHQRRQRIIFLSGILIIVAALVVVGAGVYFGWYVPERQPLQETVIRVNDTEFDMEYYVEMLKYEILQMSAWGIDVGAEQLSYMASGAVTFIENAELVRQEALKLGITVSDEEVEAKVDEELGSYDSFQVEEYREVARDAARTQLLQQKLLDEYFDQQVPLTAEQRQVMAMFLESQSQASEIRARLEAGELFSDLADEFCLDSYCKAQHGDLGWHPREILSQMVGSDVVVDSAFSAEAMSLSQPVYEETKTKRLGYWLIEVEFVDAEVEHAELKVMLLGSEQEASEIRARLENGEDFAALAAEFSQHDESKDNGGEFEIDSKGLFAEAFDEFVFNPELEEGTLSRPIKDDTVSTEGGYWLIKVADASEDRLLDEADRDVLKSDLLKEWAAGLSDKPENTVEDYLDEDKISWAIMHVLEV